MQPSIVGFKDPKADLHRYSPWIFIIMLLVSIVTIAIGVQVDLVTRERGQKKYTPPPVVIQIEDIPETRQRVTAPAPRLAIPLEVSDDVMLDDITIESTGLDLEAEIEEVAPMVEEVEEVEEAAEVVEEEIFEIFAVSEAPQATNRADVQLEYPETARRAGIEGTVTIRALVGKDGKVEEAAVIAGPEELHEAALDAAMNFVFTPAKQNDVPVKCWVQIPIKFELE
jgi:protein TonB